MDVRTFTVGPVQENCHIARRDGADEAIVIDPGEEPARLLEAIDALELAGMEIDVLFTPGHSPGHVTYSIPAERAIFSGDVLFAGSVGRTDLPGGDAATLMRS